MSVIRSMYDDFLQTLRSGGWKTSYCPSVGYSAYTYGNRLIMYAAQLDLFGEEECIEFTFMYRSRYLLNNRSEQLFQEFCDCSGAHVVHEYPSTIKFTERISRYDADWKVLSIHDIDEQAYGIMLIFYEMITFYEICARQVHYDDRKSDRYMKLTPRVQSAIISDNYLVS